MPRSFKGGRRPVVYWAICPECLTYIWVDEPQVAGEETATCPYCDTPIPLLGGEQLADSLGRVQALLEDIEQQIGGLPAAIDVHRFLFDQIEYIAARFNDRLDDIQASKDLGELEPADAEARQTI